MTFGIWSLVAAWIAGALTYRLLLLLQEIIDETDSGPPPTAGA